MIRSTLRVLLLDTPLISDQITRLLQIGPGEVEFTAVEDNVHEILARIQASQPDVLLLDLEKSWKNEFANLKTIRTAYPRVVILGRTSRVEKNFILQALLAGVTGFITTDTDRAELLEAFDTVSQGYPYFPAPIAEAIVGFAAPISPQPFVAHAPDQTSERVFVSLRIPRKYLDVFPYLRRAHSSNGP